MSVAEALAHDPALRERLRLALRTNPQGAATVTLPTDEYPHLTALVSSVTATDEYSFAAEFEVGLGIILDGLERQLG